ncbi:unnamed protein product [Didymodactylos carnosus]|uniref:Uncharacterized protein n=1 Tax=Didymodactylos carnosus TaxID=1234261 RepID=A0A8S2SLJ6_9BILA|nr:unnamed protein product [Didymodactylos carnosus]CAF4238639.1 unnamed protein product [Didymodactylos carnosus]
MELQIALGNKDTQVNNLQLESLAEHNEEDPKYYVLQSDYCEQSVNPATLDESITSPVSITDRSLSSTHSSTSSNSQKQNESGSSAYNTAESLQSFYSDEIENLERVLNASSVMYTRPSNLQHTIALQEELFRQRLRLRGIHLNETDSSNKKQIVDEKSDHIYDNIESSKESNGDDIEQDFISLLPQQQHFNTDYYGLNKRRLKHHNWKSKYIVKRSSTMRRSNIQNIKEFSTDDENHKQNGNERNDDDVQSNSKTISKKLNTKHYTKSKYEMMMNMNEPLLTVTIT